MGVISLGRPEDGMSMDDMMDLVASLAKTVEWLANGRIDSDNVREISGFNVSPTIFKHKSGIVGMNGGDPSNPNAIRFWAGNADPSQGTFRVTQGGILTAIGAQIQSASGFPRVEMNNSTNLLGAYLTANDAIRIVPNYSGGTPALYFYTGGSLVGLFQDFGSSVGLTTPFGVRDIVMSSGKSLFLSANNGIEMTCAGIRINGNIGVSGTVYVSSTPGGPATTPITFTNGIRTS